MRLTLYTDYALRVLLYLGLKGESLSTIREISTFHGISHNHLVKVVHQLGAWGYVRTLRGRGGGIQLARPPAQINVGELVRRTEDDLQLVECLAACKGSCAIEANCSLKFILQEAVTQFLAILSRYTLADLLNQGPQMPGRIAGLSFS
ncbi:Rrf2 family transcriptional regulator [Thermithiobacillus plumbiphilus]|uniref:Rrf2 family transcriptional regulator n=1 Tax=Thermithiobacillus plumbiphilus TaxID=1729899 RepID=A0ABU9DAJ8_9PROT